MVICHSKNGSLETSYTQLSIQRYISLWAILNAYELAENQIKLPYALSCSLASALAHGEHAGLIALVEKFYSGKIKHTGLPQTYSPV